MISHRMRPRKARKWCFLNDDFKQDKGRSTAKAVPSFTTPGRAVCNRAFETFCSSQKRSTKNFRQSTESSKALLFMPSFGRLDLC